MKQPSKTRKTVPHHAHMRHAVRTLNAGGKAPLYVVRRSRIHGKSNYGILDRGLRGILDLFGVWWLRRRRKAVPSVTELGQ